MENFTWVRRTSAPATGRRFPWLAMGLALSLFSCGGDAKEDHPYGKDYVPGKFLDECESNAKLQPGIEDLSFVDTKGRPVGLKDYRGKKNVVLVFTRGFYGYICPECSTQTSRLMVDYPEFSRRETEVLVVFPGDKTMIGKFIEVSKGKAERKEAPPFPILLDEAFQAVNALGIRDYEAKPSTYILDKEGKVRFAYVGAHKADRPSVKAVFAHLDRIAQAPAPPGPPPATK